MTSLVFKQKVKGPATHAIVIGVGHYLHLPGGKSKKKYSQPVGMGQLKSPPVSAKAIARWLIEEYDHPQKKLASVSLLVSETNDSEFTFNKGKTEKTVAVAPATQPEVEKAIREWHELGNQNPDHLLLFFFCGHGIARGTDLALLLADFGAVNSAPLDGAFDFRRFRQNMDECAAREQCYFVDACRTGSELLINNDGYAGNPIIHRNGTTNNSGRFCHAPAFYSTLAGAEAYAEKGKPSLFTLALLDAFAGAGVGRKAPWRVGTDALHSALGVLVKEESQRLRLPTLQMPLSDGLIDFELNVVTNPQIPVLVSCVPSSANAKATLRCEGPNYSESRNPHKDPWRLRLPINTYDFYAQLGNTKVVQREVVTPAYGRVDLEVES